MNFSKTLSRDEMKNIMAGEPNCVVCYNEGQEDAEWEYVEFNGEDPNQVCRRQGPYASGTWGSCPSFMSD